MMNQAGNADLLESRGDISKLVAIVAIIALTVIILASNATTIINTYNVPGLFVESRWIG